MKTILFVPILAGLAALSCKTPSVTTRQITNNEFKNDSTLVKDSTFLREVIVREITPASVNTIETVINIDSNGIEPFEIVVVSNTTDTLKVFGSGKKIQAKSNCAEREKYYKEIIKALKSEINNSSMHNTHNKEAVSEEKIVVEKETPVSVLLLIGFFIAIIIGLLIDRAFDFKKFK